MDTATIECQVCLRSGSSRRPFLCPTCARNALYEPRIQHAQILLSREALGKEIEQVLSTVQEVVGTANVRKSRVADAKRPPSLVYDRAQARQLESKERTQTILSHVEALRDQTKEMKDDIAKRKASLIQRRRVLTSTRQELLQQETKAVDPLQKYIEKIESRWNGVHNMTADARIFLCREAASLYGLHQRKRKKGVPGRDSYLIGGVPTVDLRDVHTVSPAQITVSTNYLAHLLHLSSHYLSVRLPAEITLPSTQNPFPQIFSPLSSYNFSTLPNGISKSSSSTRFIPTPSPPSTIRNPPRARPLHLDKPLQTLATEDPIAYSLFIDGITLLAWDVAWLCKTQGLDVGGRSWEDVCAMGRNMWLLLVAPPQAAIARGLIPDKVAPDSKPSTPIKAGASTKTTDTTPNKNGAEVYEPNEPVRPGHFSHGTNHSFLAAAEGEAYMRSWKLANPIRVIEKVKAALASERMGAEWEMLEDGEWAEEGKEDDRPQTGERVEGTKEAEGNAGGEKGKSGWMKVRSRSGEGPGGVETGLEGRGR